MSQELTVTRPSTAFVPPSSAVAFGGTDRAEGDHPPTGSSPRKRRSKILLRLAVAVAVATAAPLASGTDAADATRSFSFTELRDANGDFVGIVVFAPADGGTRVTVWATLPAGNDGIHGFHIHANDKPANGTGCVADPAQPENTHFVSADGHYNPNSATHGNHAGDMPALFFTEAGRATMSFVTDRFDTQEIKDKAVILHQGADNYGNIPVGKEPNQYTRNSDAATTLTQNTGNAGNRIACGVIK